MVRTLIGGSLCTIGGLFYAKAFMEAPGFLVAAVLFTFTGVFVLLADGDKR
jgi:hypothetical protein